jgi:hypothetical protein
VSTGESRCTGAFAKIFDLPQEGATLTYEDLLSRVHHDDRERAALLEGTAEVYSLPEGGARVRVLLPLRGGGG